MFFLSSISTFLYIHNTIIFLFVLDTSGCHICLAFRCIYFLDTSGLSFKMPLRCILKLVFEEIHRIGLFQGRSDVFDLLISGEIHRD